MSPWRHLFEPAITPLFRAWWRLRRPMTLGVRALVCDGDGRVLLVRHTYVKGWHLPGGGVERNETALEALARELAEEGGLELAGEATLFGFYANHANFPNDHVAVYRITAWRQIGAPRATEIAEHGFFPIDALPEGLTPGTRRRLAEAFEGAAISATW